MARASQATRSPTRHAEAGQGNANRHEGRRPQQHHNGYRCRHSSIVEHVASLPGCLRACQQQFHEFPCSVALCLMFDVSKCCLRWPSKAALPLRR
jgi:hypothetical protein